MWKPGEFRRRLTFPLVRDGQDRLRLEVEKDTPHRIKNIEEAAGKIIKKRLVHLSYAQQCKTFVLCLQLNAVGFIDHRFQLLEFDRLGQVTTRT